MKKNHVPFSRLSGPFVLVFLLMVLVSSCSKQDTNSPSSTTTPDDPVVTNIPKTPGSIPIPPDNPQTDAKAELGRHLFFDKTLSVDGKESCAGCHQVSYGFSDIFPTSLGMNGQRGTRNAPALANVAYNTIFTWDGRFKSLEEHAPGPIFNSVEMGNNFSTTARDTVPNGYNSGPGPNDTNFLFKRLNNRGIDKVGKAYADLFIAAWGSSEIGPKGVSLDHIAKSIAAFERTIISTQSDFDRYNNGEYTVFTGTKEGQQALRGMKLFMDANGANCISCHSGYNFTDQQFHDNGIGINSSTNDQGRFNISKKDADIGKFKTPSLRNIALSAPYMHDGRFASLQEVVNSYNLGGKNPTSNTDARVRKLNLSDQDVADIVAFLKTLTDNNLASNKSNKFSNPWLN